MTRSLCHLILIASLALGGAGIAQGDGDDTPWRVADESLYRALGGKPGIAAIVEDLLINIAHDERIVQRFADTDIDRLQRLLNEQFCVLSGGPCTYTGGSMREAHHGKNISHAQFNALVENLIDALEENAIPLAAQNRLLGVLAPLHGDIVKR